jgi:hypothetical protein
MFIQAPKINGPLPQTGHPPKLQPVKNQPPKQDPLFFTPQKNTRSQLQPVKKHSP